MSQRTAPDAGDVIWVDFGPPAGHEQANRRPALVISPRSYNEASSYVVVCPITRRQGPWPYWVAIPESEIVTGSIIVDQLRAIDGRLRISRHRGRISPKILGEVRGRIASLVGLSQ